jgi:hypothetical protein
VGHGPEHRDDAHCGECGADGFIDFQVEDSAEQPDQDASTACANEAEQYPDAKQKSDENDPGTQQ